MPKLTEFTEKESIFVFGSNLAGRHGKGAALTAYKCYGAEYGVGVGRQGQSYAIPTKNYFLSPLPIYEIQEFVNQFIRYAIDNPDELFYVTAIGTGLTGYSHEEIAPLFEDAPTNCNLPLEWLRFYKHDRLS